ncbi:hypothetical protein [Fretibacter rubidus]|uniref:hypothetical protein n=1 Tax=Fretibacter rubidus TaxID=570162 RepID=UPI00352B4C2F
MAKLNLLKTTMLNYKRSEDGNFATMAIFVSSLLIMGIGIAVDTAGLTKQSRGLQDSLDGAVLAAASSGETNPTKLKKIVKQTIKQNNTHGWTMKTNVSVVNDEISATASTKYSPMILGMFGKKDFKVEVKSAAPIAQEMPLNIAMVLDRTGSMSGSNMSDLQDSAKALVQIVRDFKNPNSRISVVPFSNYVNIGMSRRNASWMNVPADGTSGPAPACYAETTYSNSGCTTHQETRYSDGVPYQATISTCSGETWTPTGNTICPPAPTITWNGCAGSRDAPDNLLADAGAGNRIGGAMNEFCGEEILPLETDLSVVDTKIDSLTASGSTYIPSGLIWGWRTLTPNAPFTEASSSSADAVKAVVLMTDGANTMTQTARFGGTEKTYHYPYGPSNVTANDEATDRIIGICDNIKADGIAVYTVAYKLPGASKKIYDTLESCASNPASAFKAKNKKQLKKAFEDIGRNLQTVRLSR